MTGTMRTIADALPSTVPAISDPWLGVATVDSSLAVLAAWAVAAVAVTGWLARRRAA
jgi:hypothetical protein